MIGKPAIVISLALILTLVSVSPIFILPSPVQFHTNTSQIEIINPAVMKSGRITSLSVSPDGSKVAFTIDGASGGSLWIADGPFYSTDSLIVRSHQNLSDAKWSNNGQELAYVASSSNSAILNVLNLSNFHDVKIASLRQIQDAQWSPSDNMISFSGIGGQEGWNIYLTDTQTWSTIQITSSGTNMYPSWSYDGSNLIFARSYNGSASSIMSVSMKSLTTSVLSNCTGSVRWPTQNKNGTVVFESNATGSWTIFSDQNGTLTDILSIATYYTNVRSPSVDPNWPLLWTSEGNRMFFVGLNYSNNSPAIYDINFSGEVLAPTYLTNSVEQQLYSFTLYHVAVVHQIASNSTIPLIVSGWDQTQNTLFAITPVEPSSFVIVHTGPSNETVFRGNPYGG